jgi:Lecithin:cholesterol acyltransferase
MTGYFSDLKLKAAQQNKEAVHKVFTILHSMSGKMRTYFLKWKEESNYKHLK